MAKRMPQHMGRGFFTHYWKNRKAEVYLFDYGFLLRLENGHKKFVLVTWQPYMEQQRSQVGSQN